jgi:type I restriction enzyme R subunit
LSQASLNFQFLETHDPVLVRLAAQAEHYFSDDPNTCLIKLRQFGELMAQLLAVSSAAYNARDDQHQRLKRLETLGILSPRAAELFHSIRRAGNEANHEYTGSHGDSLHHLKLARELAVWFHRTLGNAAFKPGPFVPPRPPARAEATDPALADELARLRAERDQALSAVERARLQAEEHARLHLSAQEQARQAEQDRRFWENYAAETEARLAQQAQELAAAQTAAETAPPAERQARIERAAQADQQIELDEPATRRLIDGKLRLRGWQADSDHLTYAKGARPHKSRNMAIAEWPTDSGPADYALFCGLTCVGVIEAKRKGKDVPAVMLQAKRYSRDFDAHGSAELPAPAGEYRVPFLYATNGRPFLQQLSTKSGIWFWDARRPTQPARPLVDWHTPEGLLELLALDADAAHQKLAAEPFDYLGLRDYQIQAIRAVEDAITQSKRECLLAMATGTGKTRTALGLIYRLIKSGRFRRVLFVVDRRALGDQAATAFQTVKLEQLESFADIYDMKGLADLEPQDETRLHVATIQGLIRRVLGAGATAEAGPPIEQYDCIIVDECHRGYNLDRELSDTELTFRDEADYISGYRRVLDYFDALKIGLTATPALHTTQIFGDPIYTYSYRDAVIDGYLIDHEPPYGLKTRLATDGIHWQAGEHVEAYNPSTQAIDLVHLPDDVGFDIDGFNRQVITEGFNRAVCAELATHIDPALPGKTLVFCVNRDHADMVVNLLKHAMAEQYGGVDDDAVARITGDVDRPDQMIRRFKNERHPSIAVTVDLLTTGVDVPEIVNLVFIRRVRSRILYAQMIGRATRLCPEIGKTYFRIFDCVSMYEAMTPYTDMKPVVQDPAITFAQLVRELGQVGDPAARALVLDQLVAKLQRKARRLDGARLQAFIDQAGGEPAQVLHTLRQADPDQALAYLAARPALPALIELLDTASGGDAQPVLISRHEDEVIAVERGYGKGQKPQDYLDSFGAYLREHMNEIPALIVVTQRPRELTRQHLRELRRALDQAGYREAALRTAYREVSNQDIAASIIGYIRQQALGEPLLSYTERVQRAMKKILAGQTFSQPQREWLGRLAKQLETEVVADRDLLDSGQFRMEGGGFARLDKIFKGVKGGLEGLLRDINQALWEQAA